jgi:hypothetical protein
MDMDTGVEAGRNKGGQKADTEVEVEVGKETDVNTNSVRNSNVGTGKDTEM